MQFGYTAMCEQTPVRQLVTDLAAAEQAGFDFSVISDHYFPWLEDLGHSGFAWVVLGGAAQVTEQLPLMTMVTCLTFGVPPGRGSPEGRHRRRFCPAAGSPSAWAQARTSTST